MYKLVVVYPIYNVERDIVCSSYTAKLDIYEPILLIKNCFVQIIHHHFF
jgi:hypothetical protein